MSVASLVLFLMVGVGHVLPAFHFARVAHRICGEHGELVHEVAATSAPPREADGPALVATDGGHEHEHCGVAAVTGSGVAIAASTSSVAMSLESVELGPGSEHCAHVGIALLAYAPKLAPPVPAA
jgi:hypothetical protein